MAAKALSKKTFYAFLHGICHTEYNQYQLLNSPALKRRDCCFIPFPLLNVGWLSANSDRYISNQIAGLNENW
jgi:hypothetical protein